MTRGTVLVLSATAVSAVLALAYLAAGGASYVPAKVQNPCEHRPWRNPQGIQDIVQQFSLSALDGAACELGVTRERLARALSTPRSLERFAKRYRIGDAQLAKAIRAGLVRAVDDAAQAGVLSPFIAAPLRETLRRVPLRQGIELIRNARSLLDRAQTFLGPAQGLLEQVLP
ncbi:MAG TPA: hypothetical protein VF770_03675 [Solirubrobacterales bacterium]